jgi:hypothetical protein
MRTPLSERLKSARRYLLENAGQYELHQLWRLLRRTAAPLLLPRVSYVEHAPQGDVVAAAQFAHAGAAASITVNQAALPDDLLEQLGEETVEFLQAIWEHAHPFVQTEWGEAEGMAFLRDVQLYSTMQSDARLARETLAFFAGPLRRQTARDFAATCETYFEVTAHFEAVGATHARLKLGPLTWQEYCAFLPALHTQALTMLTALREMFLSPTVKLEIVLILRGEEVPPCVPGTPGAAVGIAAWPVRSTTTTRQKVTTVFWLNSEKDPA